MVLLFFCTLNIILRHIKIQRFLTCIFCMFKHTVLFLPYSMMYHWNFSSWNLLTDGCSKTVLWRMNLLHQPYPALRFVILNDLAVFVGFTCIACCVTGILFACIYLTKWRAAASTSGCLPFFGLVKILVVVLHGKQGHFSNDERLLQLQDIHDLQLYSCALLCM
jgi:hypothetical protein